MLGTTEIIIIIILFLLWVIFWVIPLILIIKTKNITSTNKVLWIVLGVFTLPLISYILMKFLNKDKT